MASSARKPSKPVYKTARPYTETQWPTLTSAQITNVVDLLCNLLQPLGDHRRIHIQPSGGKKRKREAKQSDGKKDPSIPPPPVPEISSHILIGLNSVTRHLEALAAQTAPKTAPAHAATKRDDDEVDSGKKENAASQSKPGEHPDTAPKRLAFVLIPHNHPPASLAHAHIPTLVHLATMNWPKDTATRLLAVPPTYEPQIAEALHIPHVGALAVMEGAPGADALVAYVKEQVEVTACAWIDEAMKPEWKAVKIDATKG